MDVDAADSGRAGPAEAAAAGPHRWARGWRLYVSLSVPLVYLLYVVGAVHRLSRGDAALAGYVLLAAFAVAWLGLVAPVWSLSSRRFWIAYGVLSALFVAELPFARMAGFVLCIYLTILAVARFGARAAPGRRPWSSRWPSPRCWSRSRSRPGATAWPTRSAP